MPESLSQDISRDRAQEFVASVPKMHQCINASKARSYRKRTLRRNRLAMPIAAPVEICEERVLLSGDPVDDPGDMADIPSDYYDTGGYSDAAEDGPLADDFAEIADEYADYESSWQNAVGDAYSDAEEQTEEGESEAEDQGENTATDTSFTNSLQGLLGDLLIDLGATAAADSESGDGDGDADSDDEAGQAPFALPDYVTFDAPQLPLLLIEDDFAGVAPEGPESFTNLTSTEETVTTDSAGQTVPETTLVQTVQDDQTWNSVDDWQVSQSVSNVFDTAQSSDADSATN